MIYPVSLQVVGLVVGVALLGTHLLALWRPKECAVWLRNFPRSRAAGTVLIVLAGIWSFLLVRQMDLGEFARLRNVMLLAIVAGTFLSWRYVEEFLAVRALGMLALLAAEPLLGAAFLRPEQSRLLVVVLAYAWIILGLFWVGVPWTLRDQIAWLTAVKNRLPAAAWGGVLYGAAVIVCAAFLWK
ncbi:MAG: hypothetical protein ACOYMS_13615 [Terrimicrobiaceae bacterium]